MRVELIGGPMDGTSVEVDDRQRSLRVALDYPELPYIAAFAEHARSAIEDSWKPYEKMRTGQYAAKGRPTEFYWQGEL